MLRLEPLPLRDLDEFRRVRVDPELAVDVHFTPLLYELGARVPVRGLFVLEADLAKFSETAARWAEAHAHALLEPALG